MLDAKWDQWRTSTVVGICARIRETGDYSALPILADALQDAGCDDEDALARLRSELTPTTAQRLVCLIHGGEPAAAVEWMDEFLKPFKEGYYADASGDWVSAEDRHLPGVKYIEEYSLSYDDLMAGAEAYLRTGQAYCLPFVTPDEAWADPKGFWRSFEAITGIRTDKTEQMFFRCAC